MDLAERQQAQPAQQPGAEQRADQRRAYRRRRGREDRRQPEVEPDEARLDPETDDQQYEYQPPVVGVQQGVAKGGEIEAAHRLGQYQQQLEYQ